MLRGGGGEEGSVSIGASRAGEEEAMLAGRACTGVDAEKGIACGAHSLTRRGGEIGCGRSGEGKAIGVRGGEV